MMRQIPQDKVLMLFINCDLNIALERANKVRKVKDEKQMRGIKASYSTCINFINDFPMVDTYVINTSNCDDFEEKTLFDFDWEEYGLEGVSLDWLKNS